MRTPLPTFNAAAEPEGTLDPVAELALENHHRFMPDFKDKKLPVVLRGYHNDSVACREWTFESIKARTPNLTVDLDVGDAMVTDGLTFKEMRLHDYFDAVAAGGGTEGGETLYLQGYDLLELVPEMEHEVNALPAFQDGAVRSLSRAWLGPGGTVTGYHSDLADNVLSQILGHKLVKIVSPDQADRVYKTKKYDPNGHACAINADDWDPDAFPKFADVEARYVVLGPGDALFIPGGWFHYVRSLETSISVNTLGYTAKQMIVDKSVDLARRALHNVGLLGDTCTCHMMVDGKRVARR